MGRRVKVVSYVSRDASPFGELPEALVEELLGESHTIAARMIKTFEELRTNRESYRRKLAEKGILQKETDFLQTPTFPTTCGIDGSYADHRLVSSDLLAAAAVAVEGLTPPTEIRHWPRPHHLSTVKTVPHGEANSLVLRAIMMQFELILSQQAPHDVVMFDGSFTTPIIYMNQAQSSLDRVSIVLASVYRQNLQSALSAYRTVLQASRTDKGFAALPKYTSRKEISDALGLVGHEDRSLLTFVLHAGELTKPMEIQPSESPWHLKVPNQLATLSSEISSLLGSIQVSYYKPYDHSPAFRVEVPHAIAVNRNRFAVVLEAVKLQSGAPSIMEPYPLYLADRMVSHLGAALPPIRQTVTQEMAREWAGDLGDIYMVMHGHRTETRK